MIIKQIDNDEEPDFSDSKIKFLMKYVVNKDVLDLGCVMHDPNSYKSKYWVHKAIKHHAKSLIGLDIDANGVEYLRQRGFNIFQGDASKFELDIKFDTIHAGDLIEHLEDFAGFIESCKRHLRPDGIIVISSPNPWYWRNILKSIINIEVSNNQEHTCWLCPRTLRQLVRRHGLDVTDIQFGSRYIRDRILPLPRGVKHTSWNAIVQ